MQSFTIVAISHLDNNKKDVMSNVFLPYRPNFFKVGRKKTHQFNSRSNSAMLSSELRPISHLELREKLPNIRNESASKGKINSVVSARLKNEIKSAVLLMENRSENDLLIMSDYSASKENLDYAHKVYSSNHSSKSEKRNIGTQRRNNRWKSASTAICQGSISKEKGIDKYFKILSLKPNVFDRHETSANTVPELDNTITVNKNVPAEVNLVTSISNSITNFLTIDDIHGTKNNWVRNNLPEIQLIEESGMESSIKVETKETDKIATNQCKRVAVLRDYMNVYLNWRTTQSIAEHRDIVFGRMGHSRIRTAIPKSRLEKFNKILDEKQSTIPKKRVVEIKENETDHRTDVSSETHVVRPAYPFISSRIGSKKIIHNQVETEVVNKIESMERNEESSHNDSDEYSDIDWMEREDI